MNETLKKTMEAIEKNNMSAYYAETKEDVLPIVKSLIKEGDTVAAGGSMSVIDCGIIDYISTGNFKYLDRHKPGLTIEEIENIYRQTFFADVYFSSSNAVTRQGDLYNVDGTANRVAAIAYGPKKVIMVVGENKIVKNMEEAVLRVKRTACPKNCVRLSKNTYCKETGHCAVDDESFGGCTSPDRICCTRLITSQQRQKGRFHIIFVGESLGF